MLVLEEGYYSKDLEKVFRDNLAKRLKLMKPNWFMTIRLFKPGTGVSPDTLLRQRAEGLDGLHREIINRIDRLLYGPRHNSWPADEKFAYFCRLETKAKNYYSTEPHFHIVFRIPLERYSDFEGIKEKLLVKLECLMRLRGFEPDIDLIRHDRKNLSYIAKHAVSDVLGINTRNLPV